MKLVTEYLEQAVHFERMAEQEADEELKTKLLEQANAYFKLAEKQARELGLPPPQRSTPVHGRGRLCPGTMGYAREPVFLLSHSHPDRSRPARRQRGALRLRPPSRVHRRDSDHSGKRTRARIVDR